ncbi:hypothetical protein [Candidatus Leptofilum sp.]|uniref:hypothetical protein n=1 Tax=Candidatus Leptofilum sp. TaxID=3241576 RepID=UPI003B5BAEB4
MSLKDEVTRLQFRQQEQEREQKKVKAAHEAELESRIKAVGKSVEALFNEAEEILWQDGGWKVSYLQGWDNPTHSLYVWKLQAQKKVMKGIINRRVASIFREELIIAFAPGATKHAFSSPGRSYFEESQLEEEVARQIVHTLRLRKE